MLARFDALSAPDGADVPGADGVADDTPGAKEILAHGGDLQLRGLRVVVAAAERARRLPVGQPGTDLLGDEVGAVHG